jgi:Zn-dependent alcohol dehydrogenase
MKALVVNALGHEVAGSAAEGGPDVTQVHVGDHVVGSLARYGIEAFLETRAILES